MPQEDHLKKQIDRLGQVLGKLLADLLNLKYQGQTEEAIQRTNHVLKGEFAFDLQELINLPTADLVNTLKSGKGFQNQTFETLATVFLWIAEHKEGVDKKVLHEKSLALYENLEKTETVYSLERHWKIERLKKELEE